MFGCFQTIGSRFYPYQEIETDAVFGFDEDVIITTDEVGGLTCSRCILYKLHPGLAKMYSLNLF